MKEEQNESSLSENLIYLKLDSKNVSKSDESENLIEKEIQVNFVKDLEKKLSEGKNKNLSFDQIYEDYYDSKFITKSNIKEDIDNCCFRFGFLGIGILFGIIHLIGIYLIKSVLNALLNLIIESVKTYFYCKVKSKCSITINDDKDMPIVFNFINYYYNFTMTESIDFNLMFISGALGILLLNYIGFRFSLLLLCPFVFGPLVWLLNFDYNFKDGKTFDYGIFKILNLIFIYILIYIGIGALALISQQILVESYLKYKNRFIEKIDKQMKGIDEKEERKDIIYEFRENSLKDFLRVKISHSDETKNKMKIPFVKDGNDSKGTKNKKIQLKESKTINSFTLNKNKRLKEQKEKIKSNKFDYFFIICLMSIFGYLGKYLLNFGIDYILIKLFDKEYDKNKFFLSVIILYGILLIITVFIYSFYRYYFFKKSKKKGEAKIKKKSIKICKICGYIIYSEHRKKNSSNPKKCCQNCRLCCKLGCESIQNCCNKTFCNVIKNFCCCCCKCCRKISCFCKCCEYKRDDYQKEKEVFHYCFKEKGWCLWLNDFAANKTVEQIFPYLVLYFMLHLTTCGFENHYEKIKQKNPTAFSMEIWLPLFIITFILFFYYTLSFSRFISFIKNKNGENNESDINKKDSNDSLSSITENNNECLINTDETNSQNNNNESIIISNDNSMISKQNTQKSNSSTKSNDKKDWISLLSYNILNGTFGILLFNGVFSIVFSIYYLLYRHKEEQLLIFNDNLVLIPILMTKFHYFILNYYCTYTSETTKRLEFISSSALISFYILLFNGFMKVLKAIIPDDNNNKFNYFNIFFIIQIISSIIPVFVVLIFVIGGLIYSTGILDYLYHCNCQDCKDNFFCHQFLFCLCSFIICFGGLWIRNNNNDNIKCEGTDVAAQGTLDVQDVEDEGYECCNTIYCFGFCDCNIYCTKDNIYCCRKDDNNNKDGISCCTCERSNCFINIFNELNLLSKIIEKIQMLFN